MNPLFGLWSREAVNRDFVVFGDQQSFLERYGHAAEQTRLSSVDWNRVYVIAIQQGLCPTGGYSIYVRRVFSRADVVNIVVDFQEPGPHDIVTMAMTTPHLLLLVPRRHGRKDPLFRFHSTDGAVLAERQPLYGKTSPCGGSGPQVS